jgi:hypothetical protein
MQTCCENPVDDGCASIPELTRVCYYLGQLLGPKEFQDEHDYFANKLSLVVSKLLGHGVVCGLDVTVIERPSEVCPPKGYPPKRSWDLVISPGLAVDCNGQLIVVRREIRRPLLSLLSPSDFAAVQGCTTGAIPLFVSLQWSETPTNQCRPVSYDACASPRHPQPSRVRECVEIDVSLLQPTHQGCDGCCEGCNDARVVLSAVDLPCCDTDTPQLQPETHPELRRMFGRHDLTTIDGITWTHGGVYRKGSADRLVRLLGIRFSKPVNRETLLDPAIVEFSVHTGGENTRDTYNPHFVGLEPRGGDGTTTATELWIRFSGGDSLSTGDRVRIALRCDFIIDMCCRAIDGNHIGGKVPTLVSVVDPPTWKSKKAEHAWEPIEPEAGPPTKHCAHPPDREGPWRSGNGTPGGTFESWFAVSMNEDEETS